MILPLQNPLLFQKNNGVLFLKNVSKKEVKAEEFLGMEYGDDIDY